MNSADVRHAWVTIMMLLLSDLGWRWVGITGIIACHPRTTEGPLVFGLFYTVASYKRLNTELRSVDGEPSSQWLRKRSAVTEAAPSHCTAPSTVPQRPCLSNRPCVYQAVQLSHPYMTIGKTIALTRPTFAGKVMSLVLNMLSRLVITFLPRSSYSFIFNFLPKR